MSRIKICGLSRPCDVDFVSAAKPDLCGFIINVPKSRRNVTPDTVRALRRRLCRDVIPVGVFVNEPPETIVSLTEDGTLSMVQLHGQEDDAYIAALRRRIAVPIIQAFSITGPEDVRRAEQSRADYILLDSGGGTGRTFDWSWLRTAVRPYILAGGLDPENLPQAIARLHPYAVDLSSGVETDGVKDRSKIFAAVRAVREAGC